MKRKLSLGALLLALAGVLSLPQTARATVPVTTNAIPDHADWGYVIQGGSLGYDTVYVYTKALSKNNFYTFAGLNFAPCYNIRHGNHQA